MKGKTKGKLQKYVKTIGYNGHTLPELFTTYPSFREINDTFVIRQGADQLFYDGRPIVVDLFSGCGGFSLGFVNAGYRIVAAIDNTFWEMITYACNIPNFQGVPVHCYYKDIRKISGYEILFNLGLKKGDIDVVVGGPPCQSFSSVGNRKVGDERDYLVFEFRRLVMELQPKTFVMENVPDIRNKKLPDGTKIMDKLLEEFKG